MKKDINAALDYIHGTAKFGVVLGLENIKRLLELMGNPQDELDIIHVAGTNGKGSTSSYVTKIMEKAGYRVGLFTSPYLEVFNERIRINDDYISDEDLAELAFEAKEKVEKMLDEGYNHPTEFEIVTAIALEYYRRKNVDFVILEVGMGGRYDSTNVISKSLVSIITPIGMDHIAILGDTIEKIAYEKAGIIKENGLVICYPQEAGAQEVVEKVAREKSAEFISVPLENLEIREIGELGSIFDFKYKSKELTDLEIKLIGKHQASNASTAITTLLTLDDRGILDISEDNIRDGLVETRWMGRLELLLENPRFVIDGAHNMQGIRALKNSLSELFNYKRLILGTAILADKDVDDMVSELSSVADKVIVTQANIPRAMSAEDLGEKFKKYSKDAIVESDIKAAIDKSFDMYEEGDLILFSGSLYLIGDVRRYAKNKA